MTTCNLSILIIKDGMKRRLTPYFAQLLFFLACFFALLSCQKEALEGDADVPVPTDITPPILQDTYAEEEALLKEVDSLARRMYVAYNTRILYKWDRKAVGNVSSYPPELHKVPAYLKFMEQIFFTYIKNAYQEEGEEPDETRGLVFLKENLPVTFLLLGESINTQDNGGVSAAGLAQSNLKIFLTGVNNIALEDAAWVERQHDTFHHELAHILDRRYNRPKGFDAISAGKYIRTAAWGSLSLLEAFSRGFIEPYGASNEAEDFATIVGKVTTTGRGGISGTLETSQRLRQKYQLVVDFYRTIGIDIQGIGSDFVEQDLREQ